MTKLSDTQSIMLSKASQHEALLAVAPSNLPTAARQAVFRSMLKNLLLEEVPAPVEHRDLGWRLDRRARRFLFASQGAGLRAIGVEMPQQSLEFRELIAAEMSTSWTCSRKPWPPRTRWPGRLGKRARSQRPRGPQWACERRMAA